MIDLLEILKYTIPALIVFVSIYFTMKSFYENEDRRRKLEIKASNQKLITPIRLQAYERVVLFLERISVDNLIVRINKPTMTNGQLHTEILMQIRIEFEHNLAQQVYLSHEAWEAARTAKENTLKLINTIASKLPPDQPSFDLCKAVLEFLPQLEKNPTKIAIEFIKSEAAQLF